MEQFTDLGISTWIQGVTGWESAVPSQAYIPYWHQRLVLFAKSRIPDGSWCVFEELRKLMRELESLGYVIPDVSPKTGKTMCPDISIGKLFCSYMKDIGYPIYVDEGGSVRKYKHYYPDSRVADANIYPDEWLPRFRSWFASKWKRERLVGYIQNRDPAALPTIGKLLGLPEAE